MPKQKVTLDSDKFVSTMSTVTKLLSARVDDFSPLSLVELLRRLNFESYHSCQQVFFGPTIVESTAKRSHFSGIMHLVNHYPAIAHMKDHPPYENIDGIEQWQLVLSKLEDLHSVLAQYKGQFWDNRSIKDLQINGMDFLSTLLEFYLAVIVYINYWKNYPDDTAHNQFIHMDSLFVLNRHKYEKTVVIELFSIVLNNGIEFLEHIASQHRSS